MEVIVLDRIDTLFPRRNKNKTKFSKKIISKRNFLKRAKESLFVLLTGLSEEVGNCRLQIILYLKTTVTDP
jgi:hypothetical protein